MMLLKCFTQYASKFGKFSSGHRTGKGQFSLQSQRKAMTRNVQLPLNCIHFTCQQGHAQNPQSQASPVCKPRTSRYSSWIQKRQRIQRSNCQHLLDHRENKRIPVYTSVLLTMLKPLCRSQQTKENSLSDGNNRPPLLPPEKTVCRSRSISQNQTWNNGLVPNWERSMSRVYIVTLLV